MKLLLAAAAGVLCAAQQPVRVYVDVSQTIVTTPPTFGPAFGWEMWAMTGMLGEMNDTRFVNAGAGMAGSIIRVGGITADWVRYTPDAPASSPAASTKDTIGVADYVSAMTTSPRLGGFWPTEPQNLTYADFDTLLGFFSATGMKLLFDLNELYGRNCNTTQPGCPSCPDWCIGEWDTSNVRAFLQHLHDGDYYGGNSPLLGFELGNELITHLAATNNTRDIIALAGIIKDIWSDVPADQVPPLYAPSTDNCPSNDTFNIMLNVTGVVKGFTFHAYPGQQGNNLSALLLNTTWLRDGIMTGTEAYLCLDYWNSGPRSAGMDLWVTESSSSWNWQLPPPAQNSFLHGFFTLPELGQYAKTGVGLVARWSWSEGSPFGTVVKNGSRWDAAADYFLLRAYKALVGHGVLNTTGDDGSDVLVYAHCAAGNGNGSGNGSVVVYGVNPSTQPVELLLDSLANGQPLAAGPRWEYVFTAPGGPGDLAAFTPVLNGNVDAPLRLDEDGTPPPMPGAYVAEAGNAVTLPPRSQGFFVLLAADASAC